jgi:hypothetical protein
MCKDNTTVGGITRYVEDIKSCVPYYRVIPADKELFSLTVDHNASLNKSHAVLIVSYKKKLFFHVFHIFHIFSQFS